MCAEPVVTHANRVPLISWRDADQGGGHHEEEPSHRPDPTASRGWATVLHRRSWLLRSSRTLGFPDPPRSDDRHPRPAAGPSPLGSAIARARVAVPEVPRRAPIRPTDPWPCSTIQASGAARASGAAWPAPAAALEEIAPEAPRQGLSGSGSPSWPLSMEPSPVRTTHPPMTSTTSPRTAP